MSPRASGAIVGLLRRGSPVLIGQSEEPGVVVVTRGDWGARVVVAENGRWTDYNYTASSMVLDLTDPTGMDHGARWLAEKVGLTVGATAPSWYLRMNNDCTSAWALWVPYQPYITFADPPTHTGDRLVPSISALTNPAEALALAIGHAAKESK